MDKAIFLITIAFTLFSPFTRGASVSDEIDEKLSIVKEDPQFEGLKWKLRNNLSVTGSGKSSKIDELTLLSNDEAQEIFNLFKKFMPGSTYDGLCSFRNYFWHLTLVSLGVKAADAYVIGTLNRLIPAEASEVFHGWDYHVAPAVCTKVKNDRCTGLTVLDPSLHNSPLSLKEWKDLAKGKANFVNLKLRPVTESHLFSERVMKMMDDYVEEIGFSF